MDKLCLLLALVVILMSSAISECSLQCAHACQKSSVFSSENAFVKPPMSDMMQKKWLLEHVIHPNTKQQAPATCKEIKDLTQLLCGQVLCPARRLLSVSDSSKCGVSIRICVWLTERAHRLRELSPTILREWIHPQGHKMDTSQDSR